MTQEYHSAYQTHQRAEETVRETEARALLSCASKLEDVRANKVSREEFGSAVRHNQELWTIFQVCLCEPDNKLPRELKILLLNLSRYIDKVSFRAVRENDPSLLRSLISINRTIAAGLAKKPAGQSASASAAFAPSIMPNEESSTETIMTMA